ncbi:MAG: hypothetical protein AABY26_05005 [Nanoarchaeota archaeon]
MVAPQDFSQINPSLTKFSFKFYLGAAFIIGSLLIGALAKILLIFYFYDTFMRWTLIIIYFLTWPPLIVGAWWVGKEAADKIKKYASYKFYHHSLKEGTKRVYSGTKKAYSATKEGTRKFREKARDRTKQFKDKTLARTKLMRERAWERNQERTKKIREKVKSAREKTQRIREHLQNRFKKIKR